MRRALCILVAFCAGLGCRTSGSAVPRALPEDVDRLTGPAWSGSLTYLDYGSGQTTTIPAALRVERKPGAERAWVMSFTFPDEPKADGSSEIVLSQDGTQLDGETVMERRELDDGVLWLVTEEQGQDDDKPATIRHVYTIGEREASARKLVQSQGAAGFIRRNEYRWRR